MPGRHNFDNFLPRHSIEDIERGSRGLGDLKHVRFILVFAWFVLSEAFPDFVLKEVVQVESLYTRFLAMDVAQVGILLPGKRQRGKLPTLALVSLYYVGQLVIAPNRVALLADDCPWVQQCAEPLLG